MKARASLDRIYRRQSKDAAFERRMDDSFRRLGITRQSLGAFLKTQRAIRFAAGHATRLDRFVRAWEARRAESPSGVARQESGQ